MQIYLYNTNVSINFATKIILLINMKTKIDIRRAITERGYTITSFCQKFDLRTQNIIQNYIKGNPTIKRLEDLCEKLECDVTDLFYPIADSGKTANNTLLFSKENEKEENKTDSIKETEYNTSDLFAPASEAEAQRIQLPEAEKAGRVTTFCPHCGARVRVGVVLLPE